MSRNLSVALAICASLSGCKLSADYDGTRYRCDESGQCPDGFSCVAGWCEAELPSGPDGGPDGGPTDVPAGCGTMAKVFNDFETSTIDTGRWSYWNDGPLTVAHEGGRLVFTVPAGQSDLGAGYQTHAYYRMQGSRAFVEVLPLEVDSGASFTFALRTLAAGRWYMSYQDGALVFRMRDAVNEYTLASVPYVAEEHRFWQIREQDGTVYWETSADGATWTAQASNSVDTSEVLVRVRLSIRANTAQPVDHVLMADNLNGGVANDISWCPGEILVDDFDDVQIAPVWTLDNRGNCSVFEQGGQLVFAFPEPFYGRCGYESLSRYDMTRSALVLEAPKSDPGAMLIYVNLDFPHNGDDARFVIGDGMLSGEKEVSNVNGLVFSMPFDPVQHRWLRLRGEGGTVYWETSPDGQDWQLHGLHSQPPYDLTEVEIEIYGKSETGAIDNIGNGFDNLNLGP
jgi:hypothetical protein